jgi:hypothetical protein
MDEVPITKEREVEKIYLIKVLLTQVLLEMKIQKDRKPENFYS